MKNNLYIYYRKFVLKNYILISTQIATVKSKVTDSFTCSTFSTFLTVFKGGKVVCYNFVWDKTIKNSIKCICMQIFSKSRLEFCVHVVSVYTIVSEYKVKAHVSRRFQIISTKLHFRLPRKWETSCLSRPIWFRTRGQKTWE